jgi:hypothetical protein
MTPRLAKTFTYLQKVCLPWLALSCLQIPLLPSTYFIPGDFLHFFLFFMPLIVVPGYVHADRLLMVAITFALGPMLAMGWTYAAAGGWTRSGAVSIPINLCTCRT